MSSDEGGNSGISELEQMLRQVTVTRFKIQHPATIENLPDEILSNIFIRLLARQLAQMRSVSKSWNALLSDTSFVKSHLHHSIRNNNQQVLLVSYRNSKPFKQYLCKPPYLEPINFIKHIPNNLPKRVIGAVNGLICFSEYGYSNIYIWNPSLSAMSAIPPSMRSFTLPNTYVSTSIRFGFDPKTNDYKLVKISGTLRDKHYISSYVKEWLGVEVYNMRNGSWEYITQPFPSHITRINDSDYTCVDGHHGHLHWENKTGGSRSQETIVGFDLGSETFREIPLPDAILDSSHGITHLGVLGGKLCVVSWRTSYEVWVMEAYGVHESWVKRHIFSLFTGGLFSYGFTSRSELILKDEYSRLVLYDPIADKTTRSEERVWKIRKFVEYVDSLVWI